MPRGARLPTSDSLRLKRAWDGAKNKRFKVVGYAQGTTGVLADGVEESEDCIVASTSGNWWYRDPAERRRSVLM